MEQVFAPVKLHTMGTKYIFVQVEVFMKNISFAVMTNFTLPIVVALS